jgi:hypothetical protein
MGTPSICSISSYCATSPDMCAALPALTRATRKLLSMAMPMSTGPTVPSNNGASTLIKSDNRRTPSSPLLVRYTTEPGVPSEKAAIVSRFAS